MRAVNFKIRRGTRQEQCVIVMGQWDDLLDASQLVCVYGTSLSRGVVIVSEFQDR